MSVTLQQLHNSINTLLTPHIFNDYCPNGLQVEGKAQISKIVSGVTASQALLEQAIKAGADAIVVHHGWFWRGEDPCVVGIKKRRLQALLAADVSLLAYHLPLDAHPEVGNNVMLAKELGLTITGNMDKNIGCFGRLAKPLTPSAFSQHIQQVLNREPFWVGDSAKPIETIAWCTGAAQGYIEQAINAGVDAFLTGEVSEQTVHLARESGVTFFAAGHHATERWYDPASQFFS
jgi:dinuclear metal center YbgI/SA1388 family protein